MLRVGPHWLLHVTDEQTDRSQNPRDALKALGRRLLGRASGGPRSMRLRQRCRQFRACSLLGSVSRSRMRAGQQSSVGPMSSLIGFV